MGSGNGDHILAGMRTRSPPGGRYGGWRAVVKTGRFGLVDGGDLACVPKAKVVRLREPPAREKNMRFKCTPNNLTEVAGISVPVAPPLFAVMGGACHPLQPPTCLPAHAGAIRGKSPLISSPILDFLVGFRFHSCNPCLCCRTQLQHNHRAQDDCKCGSLLIPRHRH